MKVTIEIDDNSPRYELVLRALTAPLDAQTTPLPVANAWTQMRDWQEVFRIAPYRKIEAIRKVREITRLGLKDAKDLVEGI